MRRRSKEDREVVRIWARKARSLKRRNAPGAGAVSSRARKETEFARVSRERDEALEQLPQPLKFSASSFRRLRQQFRRDLRAGRFTMEFAESAPEALFIVNAEDRPELTAAVAPLFKALADVSENPRFRQQIERAAPAA